MADNKNASKIAHLRKNYIRFPLDLKPDVLDAFKAACQERGTTPTAEIKRFIAEYCAESKPEG